MLALAKEKCHGAVVMSHVHGVASVSASLRRFVCFWIKAFKAVALNFIINTIPITFVAQASYLLPSAPTCIRVKTTCSEIEVPDTKTGLHSLNKDRDGALLFLTDILWM